MATLRACKRQHSQLEHLITRAKFSEANSCEEWREVARAELAALQEPHRAAVTALDGNMHCFDCRREDSAFKDIGYTDQCCGGQSFAWWRVEFLQLLEWDWEDKGRRRENGVAGMVGFVARQLGKLEGQELVDALMLVSEWVRCLWRAGTPQKRLLIGGLIHGWLVVGSVSGWLAGCLRLCLGFPARCLLLASRRPFVELAYSNHLPGCRLLHGHAVHCANANILIQ